MQPRQFELELGRISPLIEVEDRIIRYIPRPPADPEDEDCSGYSAQGHITNTGDRRFENLILKIRNLLRVRELHQLNLRHTSRTSTRSSDSTASRRMSASQYAMIS